jgi:hypothetical protein
VGEAVPGSDAPARRQRFRLGATAVQASLALCCWLGLGAIVYAVSPDDSRARAAFFLALFGALFFTLAPILRALSLRLSHSRIYQQAAGTHATRQALLLATFVVLNALLQMMRTWSEFNALLLFGTFAVIEVVALSRR